MSYGAPVTGGVHTAIKLPLVVMLHRIFRQLPSDLTLEEAAWRSVDGWGGGDGSRCRGEAHMGCGSALLVVSV